MAEGLDFSEERGGGNIYYWENIDEGYVQSELESLASRINNVADLLDGMVYHNNYESTQDAFNYLWINDLGSSGWISYFLNENDDHFSPFVSKKIYPSWYGTAEPEEKRQYDMARKYYVESSAVIKPMGDLRKIMMGLPLKDSFQFMRVTYNFDGAGFTSTFYYKINNDLKGVSNILNSSWNALESGAIAAKRFYEDIDGKLTESNISEYRKARLKDYVADVQTSMIRDTFTVSSDGVFSVNSNLMTKLIVIDKYTLQISVLSNIEEAMKEAMEASSKLAVDLERALKEVTSPAFTALVKALDNLNGKIYEYCEAGLHVYTSYKNRENEMPYIFVRPLPAMSEIKPSMPYGFDPHIEDPWYWGTSFEKMYNDFAKALTLHCKDFVNHHGPKLKQ